MSDKCLLIRTLLQVPFERILIKPNNFTAHESEQNDTVQYSTLFWAEFFFAYFTELLPLYPRGSSQILTWLCAGSVLDRFCSKSNYELRRKKMQCRQLSASILPHMKP